MVKGCKWALFTKWTHATNNNMEEIKFDAELWHITIRTAQAATILCGHLLSSHASIMIGLL